MARPAKPVAPPVATATPASSPTVPPAATPAQSLTDASGLTATLTPPAIRIGFVVDAARVSIGANSGMRIWVGANRTTAHRLTFELANADTQATVRFRVQAASVTDLSLAQQAATRISDGTGIKAEPVWNEATRTYQVKAGMFNAREDAAALARQIAGEGFVGAFVTTENQGGAFAGPRHPRTATRAHRKSQTG